MKKIKIRILSFVLVMISITASPLNVFAAADTIETHSTNAYVHIDQDGNELIFPTLEDYNVYVQAHRSPRLRYGEEWRLVETLASSSLSQYFLGYHQDSPTWAKASQYVLTSGRTYSISAGYSWQGVSINLGFTYFTSLAITIPADSSRFSRLGIAADYSLKKEKYAEYQYGKPTGNTRTSTYAKKTEHYYIVKYQ